MKQCRRCGEPKPLDEFYGRRNICKKCHKKDVTERHNRNRERDNARLREWQSRNRDRLHRQQADYRADPEHRVRAAIRAAMWRASKRGVLTLLFTEDQLRAKFAYWNDCCWICGDAATDIDHVKPLAKGGVNTLANIRPACDWCNNHKWAMWPVPSRAWLLGFTDRETRYLAGHLNDSF